MDSRKGPVSAVECGGHTLLSLRLVCSIRCQNIAHGFAPLLRTRRRAERAQILHGAKDFRQARQLVVIGCWLAFLRWWRCWLRWFRACSVQGDGQSHTHQQCRQKTNPLTHDFTRNPTSTRDKLLPDSCDSSVHATGLKRARRIREHFPVRGDGVSPRA